MSLVCILLATKLSKNGQYSGSELSNHICGNQPKVFCRNKGVSFMSVSMKRRRLWGGFEHTLVWIQLVLKTR